MAFTVSAVANSVFGNKNVKFLTVTADAASDSILSGFGVVESVQWSPSSMSTGASGGAKVKLNVLSAGTASPGRIAITGVTSGDVFFLVVYGR